MFTGGVVPGADGKYAVCPGSFEDRSLGNGPNQACGVTVNTDGSVVLGGMFSITRVYEQQCGAATVLASWFVCCVTDLSGSRLVGLSEALYALSSTHSCLRYCNFVMAR